MRLTLHHCSKQFKVILFLSVWALCVLLCGIIFLAPVYQKLQSIQQQAIALNLQWQQRRTAAIHRQQLQQDTTLLQYPYAARLQILHQQISTAELYTQIAVLAKSHDLQILVLKPQQHQAVGDLTQQILNLNMNGPELKLLNFLQLLMHQPWLLEIQQLELTPIGTGVHLQAELAAYYYDAT